MSRRNKGSKGFMPEKGVNPILKRWKKNAKPKRTNRLVS